MKKLLLVVILLIVSSANLGAVYYQQGGNSNSSQPMYAKGVLVIDFAQYVNPATFKAQNNTISTGLNNVDNAFIEFGVNKMEKLFSTAKSPDKNDGTPDLSRYYRIEFPPEVDLQTIKEQLEQMPGVKKVEMVGIHQVALVPNDPGYSNQWHHHRADDHDIDSPEAWDVETGDSAVIVAIVDTGVLWTHPDLGGSAPYTNGNIWVNWAEINGVDGVDDDGNGYIDDYRGWDWVQVTGAWSGEDATTPDNDPTDFNGHGTHCAGIVAAIANNGQGVAGVAGGFYPTDRGVKIMPLRVGWSAPHPTYGYEVGYVRMDFCAQAFYYAADNGADVISCSWGSSNSGGISAALSYAVSQGIVVCKAAGNDDNNVADFLCQQPTVVSVASTTTSDSKSSFSSYGPWVDISAPGSSIYSTYSNHGTATYASLSGTSMATPMTAGECALIKSRSNSLSKTEIESILFSSAENIDAENPSYVGQLGAGRINSYNAVTQLLFGTFEATPRMGYPPLNVDFTGVSPFDIDTWTYHFGDGDSSQAQNPSHVYQQPGAYTVTLDISSSMGDAETVEDSFIYVIADTLEAVGFEGDISTSSVVIPLRFKNVIPIEDMILPMSYEGPLDLIYDSISTVGTRCDYFERVQLIGLNPGSKKMAIRMTANNGGGSLPLPAGDGDILKFYFHVGTPIAGTSIMDTTTFNNYVLDFSTILGDYIPEYNSSEITITNTLRGDANADETVNVSDAVYIINFIFLGSDPPTTDCGGDANSDGQINVSDAVFIINYVFIAGNPAPGPCF